MLFLLLVSHVILDRGGEKAPFRKAFGKNFVKVVELGNIIYLLVVLQLVAGLQLRTRMRQFAVRVQPVTFLDQVQRFVKVATLVCIKMKMAQPSQNIVNFVLLGGIQKAVGENMCALIQDIKICHFSGGQHPVLVVQVGGIVIHKQRLVCAKSVYQGKGATGLGKAARHVPSTNIRTQLLRFHVKHAQKDILIQVSIM
jgi:hypothetical protein